MREGVYEHYQRYCEPTTDCVTIEPQVFSPDMVNSLKELTQEIRELRKLMEERKLK